LFPKLNISWRGDVLEQRVTSRVNHKWYSTALRKMTSYFRSLEETVGTLCMSPSRLFEGRDSQN
jgi:hypothetical protein